MAGPKTNSRRKNTTKKRKNQNKPTSAQLRARKEFAKRGVLVMADPVVVGYEGQKFIIDTNTRALGLYRPNYAGAGSFWSAREQGTDAAGQAYQVPASKKFCLLQHNWTCIGAEGQIFIYDHDT